MKRIGLLVLVLLGMLTLASCEVYVYGEFDRGFVLESASYRSEYSYNGASVVCDDRSTRFEYELAYQGEIEYVEVSLRGKASGRHYSVASFSPSNSENEVGRISRTFSVSGGIAPLALRLREEGAVTVSDVLRGEVSIGAQAIEVVPRNPETIGYTTIEIQVETEGDMRLLSSPPIRVLDYCD